MKISLRNKVSISPLTVMLERCLIVCLSRLYGSREIPAKNRDSIYKKFCPPWIFLGIFEKKHPPVSRFIARLNSGVPVVLGASYKSKVFSSVVQAIMIYVVDFLSVPIPHDDFVHIDETRFPFFFTARHIGHGIPTAPLVRSTPFEWLNDVRVIIVDNCHFALRQCYCNHALILT